MGQAHNGWYGLVRTTLILTTLLLTLSSQALALRQDPVVSGSRLDDYLAANFRSKLVRDLAITLMELKVINSLDERTTNIKRGIARFDLYIPSKRMFIIGVKPHTRTGLIVESLLGFLEDKDDLAVVKSKEDLMNNVLPHFGVYATLYERNRIDGMIDRVGWYAPLDGARVSV